jgi:demethylmenaquinone methyltransferase/2-methoxy-6-polyprenyl-1,4-benzoquinol methylase
VSTPSLDKQESRIRAMFGNIAHRYDLLNHTLSLNVDRYWRRRTTRLAPPQGNDPILDVCTGTGDLALAYDRAARGQVAPGGGGRPASPPMIVGSDFCLPMLVRAEAKATRKRLQERIRFVEADTQHLPFPAGTFQLTTVAFGLRNVSDTDQGLAEMVRVTRCGGRVAILEFSRPQHWFFGRLYRAYFRWLLPAIGQAVSRSRDKAYRYLPASVMEFPAGVALAEKLRFHGLTDVRWHPMTFGIVTLYVGRKP